MVPWVGLQSLIVAYSLTFCVRKLWPFRSFSLFVDSYSILSLLNFKVYFIKLFEDQKLLNRVRVQQTVKIFHLQRQTYDTFENFNL